MENTLKCIFFMVFLFLNNYIFQFYMITKATHNELYNIKNA